MRISALIVSWNVRDRLARCLESLHDVADIVVVDNASEDGSAAMVRERFPRAALIAESENRGFAAAVNRAARAATGEAFLLLNPDAELSAGAAAEMAGALDRHPRAGAIGFRQQDRDGRFQLAVGPPPLLSLDLVRRFVQRRLDRGDTRLAGWLDRAFARAFRVPWVAGSALLVRREAFERVGGMDERYFLFFEDIDFCLRLRAAGYEVWHEPSVTVIHERGASAARDPALARRAYRDSQLRFWTTHRGPGARRLVAAYQRWIGEGPR